MLIKVPSLEAVYDAIKDMNPEGAVGPDGFGGTFYVHCWNIMKANLYAAVQAFFHGYYLPKAWSSTLILPVPKVSNPNNFGDMRPISLCNLCAKIILKVLTDRMVVILPHIISFEQSGFVRGRNISENVLLAQEMLHKIDANVRGSNVVLKWIWLRHMIEVMRQFGFDGRFIDMVWRLLSNCWYSVSVNGQPEGFFSFI